MRKQFILLIAVTLLVACSPMPATPQPGAVETAVAQTVAAWTAAAPASTDSPVPTNTVEPTDIRKPTSTQLNTPMHSPEKFVEEWEGVGLGMCADDVLVIHPKSEMISDPKNLGTDAEGLIVAWNYPAASLILKRRWGDDGIYCYRVQEIQLHQ